MDHSTTPTQAVGPSGPGALAGFQSVCSCGFVVGGTFALDVQRDAWEHVAYMAALSQGPKALRAFVNRNVR